MAAPAPAVQFWESPGVAGASGAGRDSPLRLSPGLWRHLQGSRSRLANIRELCTAGRGCSKQRQVKSLGRAFPLLI